MMMTEQNRKKKRDEIEGFNPTGSNTISLGHSWLHQLLEMFKQTAMLWMDLNSHTRQIWPPWACPEIMFTSSMYIGLQWLCNC